ncbi:hypothetical protein KXD40_004446 [Peronospora effusa]|nr:hypothetical protein KXD40_004446 [Peronospora effusa]
MSDYEEEDEKWVQWFCSLSGNESFCEVAQSYIEDSFNLYGLRAMVRNYQDALNIILDMTDIPYDDDVPAYAAELYGLIHARYIITAHGLDAMMKKYREGDFGVCPRALCDGHPVVPAGLHDEWKKSEMKVYCPKCRDLYTPASEYQTPTIDGAYFGTTFPHLFFLTYRELEPAPSTLLYVPRVFGYKIYNKSENRRRLAILAKEDEDEDKTQQQRRTLTGARRKGEANSTAEASSSRIETKLQLQRSPFDAEWRDVTQLMSAAAKELKVGQLMHEDDFKLFDSMSALELMDPKMDSGMLVNGAPPQSISARLESGAVPLEFLSARDVLATLDELSCCETGWLNGLPLVQTLLTSVYMHRDVLNALFAQLVTPLESLIANDVDVRRLVKDNVGKSAKDSLRLVMCAVVLATLKTADLIRDAVLRADIYEEEDFSPGNGFNAGVLAPMSVKTLNTMLQVTQERLEVLLAQHKAVLSKKSSKKKLSKKTNREGSSSTETASASGYELLCSNARVGALMCEAFIRRVQLRRELLAAYACLGLADGALDLQRVRKCFERAYELVEGMSTERLELDPECFTGKSIGFDPSISRLLLSGSPPRDIKVPLIDETLGQMKKVLEEMVIGCSPPDWNCMEDLRIFLTEFSRQQPTIVVRSYVLLFLYADSKIYAKYNFMDWLSETMVMNGVPSVLLSTQEGVLYSSRCIETVYESLKVFLHNRSRQRARIEGLLDEWSILQAEATAVDERFTTEMKIPKAAYPRYFTAWSLEESVQLMVQYVVLGLEMELYAPSELGTVYWYLDYLEGSRLQNLNVTWTFVQKLKEVMPQRRGPPAMEQLKEETVTLPPPPPAAISKSSKGSKTKHKKHHNGIATAISESRDPTGRPTDTTKARFLREIKYTELLRSLMRAYFQLFKALEREGLVEVKSPMYSTFTIRFQHRFAAFQKLHYPAALTYEDFNQTSDFSSYELDLIYKSAEECFKTARTHAEALLSNEEGINTIGTTHGEGLVRGLELQSLLKVSISNCVRLAQRSQNTGGGNKMKKSLQDVKTQMEFDFSIHPHFPVMVLLMFTRRILSVFGRASRFSPAGARALHVEASKTSITDAITKEKVLVFSKTTCPFCARVKEIFNVLDTNYKVVELDTRDDGAEIQTLLLDITGQRTVPNVFMNGKHIGGCDSVMDLYAKSELASMLEN